MLKNYLFSIKNFIFNIKKTINTTSNKSTENFKKILKKTTKHPYHLVMANPYPFIIAWNVFTIVLLLLGSFFNLFLVTKKMLIAFSCITILWVLCWFFEIAYESTYEGKHTKKVQIGLQLGMLLFILSEIMFFFSFFWSFFHNSFVPSIWVGNVWPPQGLKTLNPWGLPLLNTFILLYSGLALTISHRAILAEQREVSIKYLILTILLGIMFTFFQYVEYIYSPFSINDSVYGSIFFVATGFHGIHVIIGTFLLICSLIRLLKYEFRTDQHFGFEAAAWYWHFVDVVWLFLFISIYWWGSAVTNKYLLTNLPVFYFKDIPPFSIKKKAYFFRTSKLNTFEQYYFQDSASVGTKFIFNLYDDLFVLLIISISLISILLLSFIFSFNQEKWCLNKYIQGVPRQITHLSLLEIIWTVFPAFCIGLAVDPSFYILYSSSKNKKVPELTIKVTGNQWFWSYQYSFPYSSLLRYNTKFDQYMLSVEDLEIKFKKKGNSGHHLLDSNQLLILPVKTFTRFLITATDVIHSFAVPALFIKTDACPGRLNEVLTSIKRNGSYYGQCSEICGIQHSFMPISIKTIPKNSFFFNQDEFIFLKNKVVNKAIIQYDGDFVELSTFMAPYRFAIARDGCYSIENLFMLFGTYKLSPVGIYNSLEFLYNILECDINNAEKVFWQNMKDRKAEWNKKADCMLIAISDNSEVITREQEIDFAREWIINQHILEKGCKESLLFCDSYYSLWNCSDCSEAPLTDEEYWVSSRGE